MRSEQRMVACRLNWYGLMKRAWPDDPEIEGRLRFYTALYVQGKMIDQAANEQRMAQYAAEIASRRIDQVAP